MKNAMVIIFLIIGLTFIPGGMFAQQEAHHQETPAVAPGEIEPDISEDEEETDQETTGGGMMARHQQMMSKMQEMNAQLEQKIETMNQATGEQKIQAMTDVLNTFFSQRREMMGKMMDMHGRMCKMMSGKKHKGMMSMKDDGRMMKMKKRTGDEEKSMIIIIQE